MNWVNEFYNLSKLFVALVCGALIGKQLYLLAILLAIFLILDVIKGDSK